MGTTNPPPTPTPDQLAAHDFLSELRTRISVQPLPYQSGVETRALQSLREIFDHARAAMKGHPGCAGFARAVTHMLNVDLRPVTAKWHRALAEGRLDSRDGADEFRGDLAVVQSRLREFAQDMHEMAYGTRDEDELSPPVLSHRDLRRCLEDVRFGIVGDHLIDTDVAGHINQAEAKEVHRRREIHGIRTPAHINAVGVGLSGGGIRSATFCLGAMQVLADRNLLRDVDFLSTVSGGGYTGCFLTTRLGTEEPTAGAADDKPHAKVAGPYGPDPDAVRWLRQHAKYLAAADLKQSWSMVTATLAGMLLNWTAPLFVIAAAALAATCAREVQWPQWLQWPLLAMGVAVGAGVALIFYALAMRVGERTAFWAGVALAILVAAIVAVGVGWLIDGARCRVMEFSLPGWEALTIVGAGAVSGPAVLRFIPLLQKPAVRRIVLRVLLSAAGVVIPLAAVVLFYVLFHLGGIGDPRFPHCVGLSAAAEYGSLHPLHYLDGKTLLLVIVILLGVLSVLLLNVNMTSPHRLYRDKLARTFIHKDERDTTLHPLKDINLKERAPYHLVNATVNLPTSRNSRLRDRRGDFFMFSKHWCGAPTTGYVSTSEWRTNGHHADLATAMAISGAAFSSHMGLASKPTLTALLTFLNVRLGFWIAHPKRKWLPGPPGFLCLLREMFGLAMSDKRVWLNLSDGGHIENMAVYELLRRRCKFIISVDGEADPRCSFHGHLTLVRHAQIDLGIRIDSTLDDLRPNAKSRHSRTHYMFCRVHYPAAGGEPESTGLLLYVKLSATGNEEELIKRYRLANPDFPHQTTLDQFFDEEQFEAYRQLGVHVMDGLFSRALMNGDPPATIAGWFRRLAINLLEPARR